VGSLHAAQDPLPRHHLPGKGGRQPHGTPLDRGNVRKRGFYAAVEAAGLNRPDEPKLTTHDLRHAFASVIAHHGIAAVDLAVFMGHKDARVTEQTYIHPFNELATATKLREVIEAAIGEHIADSG
jgi:integrase